MDGKYTSKIVKSMDGCKILDIVCDYLNQNSLLKISNKNNCDRRTIKKILAFFNIPIIKYNKKKLVNKEKECRVCKKTKDTVSSFTLDRKWYKNICIECDLERSREYGRNNKDKKSIYWKKYKELNKDKIRSRALQYAKDRFNIELYDDIDLYEKRLNERKEYQKRYSSSSINKENNKKRYRNRVSRMSPEERAINNIGTKINKHLRNSSLYLYYDFGYSNMDLVAHLESIFKDGMTWNNYGKYGWHIDHIKPLASFNLNNKEELLKAWDLSNLQPLWAKDNLAKGSKYNGIKYYYKKK